MNLGSLACPSCLDRDPSREHDWLERIVTLRFYGQMESWVLVSPMQERSRCAGAMARSAPDQAVKLS